MKYDITFNVRTRRGISGGRWYIASTQARILERSDFPPEFYHYNYLSFRTCWSMR